MYAPRVQAANVPYVRRLISTQNVVIKLCNITIDGCGGVEICAHAELARNLDMQPAAKLFHYFFCCLTGLGI